MSKRLSVDLFQKQQKVKFLGSFHEVDSLPDGYLPEIAFIGRSNVGKSSLINAIFNNKTLAKTSSTPGKTRALNSYAYENLLYFVDLPGYGYAKLSKQQLYSLSSLMVSYIMNRANLKTIFVLIDSRIGVNGRDIEMLDFFAEYGISVQIVLTKIDKLKKGELEVVSTNTKNFLMNYGNIFADLISVSSVKKLGMLDLKYKIIDVISDSIEEDV